MNLIKILDLIFFKPQPLENSGYATDLSCIAQALNGVVCSVIFFIEIVLSLNQVPLLITLVRGTVGISKPKDKL